MKRSAALRVEALEDRSVPAGTVTISGWGTGNINVIGDPQDNQIEITQPGGPATLRITGLSGTTLALGTIPASWVSSTVPSTPALYPSGPGLVFCQPGHQSTLRGPQGW
jgi:hypothetical protein